MKLVVRLQSGGGGYHSDTNTIEGGKLGENQSDVKRIPCAVGAAISHDSDRRPRTKTNACPLIPSRLTVDPGPKRNELASRADMNSPVNQTEGNTGRDLTMPSLSENIPT